MREFLIKAEEEHFHQYKTEPRRWMHARDQPSEKRQGHWYGPFPFSKWKILPAVIEIKD
jgi:hypothetical protein